ncbi:MAG: RagB/SusD family nutrient uptake outer membrane protein [Bacteroidales bacterium]|nr:RagB/SusD family nutrient uptake outer membrane protein [Bacteroidales bacterium]
MKKIFSFIFLPLLLAGCVKLDYFPSDTLNSESLAQNPAAAVYTTDGIYSMMKDMQEFRGSISLNNTFARQYYLLNEVRADNICFSWTSTDPFWTSAQYMDDANSADASYLWMACYKMIYAANSNIQAIPEADAPCENNQLKGENYFLRAFFHLILCNLYAKPYAFGRDNMGVVLRIGTDYSVTKRSTVGECYDAIEADLKEAIRLMDPSTKRGDNGYASKEAAQALLSRVYLYEGEWQKCIDVCDEILVNEPSSYLEKEVTDLYAKSSSNKEVLWCIDVTDADVAGWSVKGLIASMYDSPNGTQGIGWGELYVADPLLDLMERFPQDKRYTDLVRLHLGVDGLFITWGETDEVNGCLTNVNVYPEVTTPNPLVLTSSITDNGDGTYSFTKDGKSYKAIPDNTASKYCDEFPGYILNDAAHTRCYVRHKMPTPQVLKSGSVIWEQNLFSVRPGGFPTWFCNKLSMREGSAYDLNTSYIMIRYSEVILNRAEAYAHLGQTDKAIADVNVMRTRAGLSGNALMTTANIAGRGYADPVDMVLDERRLEFFYEGFRTIDLIRNKKNIDRRFPSRTKTEVIPYDSPKIQYQIPLDETSVSGIPSNER